jgi:hypothetical protein
MSLSPQRVSSGVSDPASDGSGEAGQEGRRQLRQILERKLGRTGEDSKNADSLDLPLEVEAERKDLSWSALLNPVGNQSLREETMDTQGKEAAARAKPESKPGKAQSKSKAESKRDIPRKPSTGSVRESRTRPEEEPHGASSSRSARKAEDTGNQSDRNSKQSLILQLAKKDLERRANQVRTPELQSGKQGRTYTETSEESAGLVEVMVPTPSIRLPEVPKLALETLGAEHVAKEEAKQMSASSSRSIHSISPEKKPKTQESPSPPVPSARSKVSKPPISPKLSQEPAHEEVISELCTTAAQTDDQFNLRLRHVLETLSDEKVLKGLRFVGGLARYLRSSGYQD